jgi:hypothetical protein
VVARDERIVLVGLPAARAPIEELPPRDADPANHPRHRQFCPGAEGTHEVDDLIALFAAQGEVSMTASSSSSKLDGGFVPDMATRNDRLLREIVHFWLIQLRVSC